MIVLGIFAQMTLKGLIAPARIAMVQASQTTAQLTFAARTAVDLGLGDAVARMVAASVAARR